MQTACGGGGGSPLCLWREAKLCTCFNSDKMPSDKAVKCLGVGIHGWRDCLGCCTEAKIGKLNSCTMFKHGHSTPPLCRDSIKPGELAVRRSP